MQRVWQDLVEEVGVVDDKHCWDLAAKVREALDWQWQITDRRTQNRGFHTRIAR
jgi:hypothetical protein